MRGKNNNNNELSKNQWIIQDTIKKNNHTLMYNKRVNVNHKTVLKNNNYFVYKVCKVEALR